MRSVQVFIFAAVLVVAEPTKRPEPNIAFVVKPIIPVFQIAKVEFKIPMNGDNFGISVENANDMLQSVLENFDFTQTTTIANSPFVHMKTWQKHLMLSSKLFVHERGYNVEPGKFPGGNSNIPTLMVNIHDQVFPNSIDKYDDGIIEEREIRMVFLVKKYFRLAAEKYSFISLQYNKLLNLIEEANQLDKAFDPKKVKSGVIVNSSVAKEKIIDIQCYKDNKCFDKKYLLKPRREIEKFKKKYNIKEGENCTITDETVMYLCKSPKKQIHAPFVLYEIMVRYQMRGHKPEWFDYVQTYQGERRVEMLDMYRLKIKKYDIEEPDEDEHKVYEYKGRSKRNKEKATERGKKSGNRKR